MSETSGSRHVATDPREPGSPDNLGLCVLKIMTCYAEILPLLNEDRALAWRLLDAFANLVKPRKTRGKADPDRDALLLAAYDATAEGEREAAVSAAARAKTQKETNAAWKQAQRLVAEREARNNKDEEHFRSLLYENPALAQMVDGFHRVTKTKGTIGNLYKVKATEENALLDK
jgi:hypothetical protein